MVGTRVQVFSDDGSGTACVFVSSVCVCVFVNVCVCVCLWVRWWSMRWGRRCRYSSIPLQWCCMCVCVCVCMCVCFDRRDGVCGGDAVARVFRRWTVVFRTYVCVCGGGGGKVKCAVEMRVQGFFDNV